MKQMFIFQKAVKLSKNLDFNEICWRLWRHKTVSDVAIDETLSNFHIRVKHYKKGPNHEFLFNGTIKMLFKRLEYL